MSAVLIVRAEVASPDDREPFDTWYEREHLPDALKAFGAARAWRGWSHTDARVHFAFYEFASLGDALGISDSKALRELIAEFDRTWGTRVVRSREIVEVGTRIEAA